MPKLRKKDTRRVKPVLHIFCEGEKTEPNYLKGYLDKHHPANRRLKMVKIEKRNDHTPVELVKEVVDRKKSESPGDFFWVVYDRESNIKYSDEKHEEAYQNAKKNGVEIALSNVCFEVWLLLHFVGSSSYYKNYGELLKLSPLKIELKKLGVVKYGKSDRTLFSKLSDKIATARQRAKAMNKATKKASPKDKNEPYQLNPYTDVHKLLDAIDQFVKDWD